MPKKTDIWSLLNEGFCPYQTMPGYSAFLYGSKKTGIVLMTTSDWGSSFGEGTGVSFQVCPPEHIKNVIRNIEKVARTFSAAPLWEVEEFFEEKKTVENSIVLPCGTTLRVGDYVDLSLDTGEPGKPLRTVILIDCIPDGKSFFDDRGRCIDASKVLSATVVNDIIGFAEEELSLENLRGPGRYYGRIFGHRRNPEKVKVEAILLDGKDSGFLRLTMSKRSYNAETGEPEEYSEMLIINRELLNRDYRIKPKDLP